MITFPNAKINLGLNIVAKRPDGYHDIETVFYPIPLRDALEIVPSHSGKTELHISGIKIDGDPEKNLIMQAYRSFQSRFDLPPLDIYLHKAIPFGAGLGGGSADAAYMLNMLRTFFKLPISDDELCESASSLGADCPFFIYNHPLMAEGIGDIFTPVNVSLKGYHIILVKPPVAVPTAEAYAKVKPTKPTLRIPDIINKPVTEWKAELVNDFESSVFTAHPDIKKIKETLYNEGADYASMSGSGSAVYGLFREKKNIKKLFPGHFVWDGICEI